MTQKSSPQRLPKEAEKLTATLRAKTGYDAVDFQAGQSGQIRMLGRVQDNRTSMWLVALHHILTSAATRTGWTIDVSKHYFIRGGKLIFGWRIIMQTKDFDAAVADLMNIITTTPRGVSRELTEFPLVGTGRSRMAGPGERGAHSISNTSGFVPKALVRR